MGSRKVIGVMLIHRALVYKKRQAAIFAIKWHLNVIDIAFYFDSLLNLFDQIRTIFLTGITLMLIYSMPYAK